MSAGPTDKLPKILAIDDQFGRCSLGNKFRKAVSKEVFAGYEADRQNLCLNYGLIDITGDARPKKPDAPVAETLFCPAQRWDDDTQRIENALDVALQMVRRGWPFSDGSRWALLLLDLRFVYGKLNTFGDPQEGSLFGVDGILPRLRQEFGDDLPIVVLSSTKKEENNPRIRQLGALDFIQRVPGAGAPPEQARQALQRALFNHGLLEDQTGVVVGRSLPVLKMLRQARRGAVSARNILLLGETGTGKGLLAQYIHSVSPRSSAPFEVFHAAHRPAELQADELFGHWKGAFTGAQTDTPGIFERANAGTLFIDEVADIDLKVQQTLMQPIEERKVRRLGQPASGTPQLKDVDVLILLATNRNLSASPASGAVKLDFLNRINAFSIEVPALRDRHEDIPPLVSHLAGKIAPSWKGRFLPEAMDVLVKHDWREGNIRELRNVIERALVNNPDQDITARDVSVSVKAEHVAHERVADKEKPETEEKERARWQAITDALRVSPETLSVAESEASRNELRGAFLDLLAHVLEWSLRMNKQDGKPNLTATARFLLGRDDVSTMEAKQFLKKLLTLDTRGKGVAKKLAASTLAKEHETLNRLLAEIAKEKAGKTK